LSDKESEDEVIGVETGSESDSEKKERKKRKKSTKKEMRVRKIWFEDKRQKGKEGVKNVWSGSRVTQSRAELLRSERELTTKVGEQLMCCASICCCVCGCVFQED